MANVQFPASVTIVDLPVGTTVTGSELFEAVQTVSGIGQSVQLSLSNMLLLGGLPTGGATGTLLNKSSGANYSTQFSAITTFVAVGTALATSGSATSIVAYIPNNAIGTLQLATNAGLTGTLSVLGTASFSGGIVATGTFGQVGTSLITGTFGIVGTTLATGAFNIVGTSIVTGVLNVSGTATFSSGIVTQNATSGVLLASSTGVVSAVGGLVLLNTLTPNNVASTNDTTSFTSSYRNYMIMFDTVCPATQTTTLQVTLATSGSAFTTAGYVSLAQIDVNATVVTDTSTAALLLSGTRSTTQLQTSTVTGVSGFIKFFNPSSSVNNKAMVGEVNYPTPGALGTATLAMATINGVYANAAAVTGINFAFNSGNIQTGTIKIYGMT